MSEPAQSLEQVRRVFGVPALVLVGILALGAAFVHAYSTTHFIVEVVRARSWAKDEARIQRVNLREKRKGAYEVECLYEYIWSGRTHIGRRVSFAAWDNWQQDTYRLLKAAHDDQRSIPCYIDPSRPSESVLDRDICFSLLVAWLVGLAVVTMGGVSAIAYGVYLRSKPSLVKPTAEVQKGRPWMANSQWASGLIRPKSGPAPQILLAAGVFWSIVGSPLLLFLPAEVTDRGHRIAFSALAFPLIGLLTILIAARTLIRRHKFGRSCLRLKTLPGVVGGDFVADLLLDGRHSVLGEVKVTLSCVNTIVRETWGGRGVSDTSILWSETQSIMPPDVVLGRSEVRIPVEFQIPASCRPYDDSYEKDVVSWQLNVKTVTKGVNLALSFDVPVFHSAAAGATISSSGAIQQNS